MGDGIHAYQINVAVSVLPCQRCSDRHLCKAAFSMRIHRGREVSMQVNRMHGHDRGIRIRCEINFFMIEI